jgi:hypothetical protein
MRMLGYAIGFMLASTLVNNITAQPIDSVKGRNGIHMFVGKGGTSVCNR